MPQRPNNFTLNLTHPLAKGLVFAGLGAHAGSTRYHDSSVFGRTGTLTNMDPTTDWVQNNTLNRIGLEYVTASSQFVSLPQCGPTTVVGSLSFWALPASLTALNAFIETAEQALVYQGLICYANATTGTLVFQYGSGVTNGPESRYSFTTTSGISANQLVHIACVAVSTTSLNVYVNGVSWSGSYSGTASSYSKGTTASAVGKLTTSGTTYYNSSRIFDPCVYHRALTLPEIQQLADPSNVMLSGLIQYPRRKWWPVAGSVTPATFKAAWAASRRQVIGGGIT